MYLRPYFPIHPKGAFRNAGDVGQLKPQGLLILLNLLRYQGLGMPEYNAHLMPGIFSRLAGCITRVQRIRFA